MTTSGSLKNQAVIFDLDGVVIDSERIFAIVDGEFLHARGVIYERERIAPLLMGKGSSSLNSRRRSDQIQSGRTEEARSLVPRASFLYIYAISLIFIPNTVYFSSSSLV